MSAVEANQATPRPAFDLKSTSFRREREPGWRRLEALLEKARTGGLAKLETRELLSLPILYRAALSSLSVARSISLDQNVVHYLEGLAGRAYLLVYGGRTNALAAMGNFLRFTLPGAVRKAGVYIALSAFILALGVIVGYVLTLGNADWYYSFVSDSMAAGRGPNAETESLREVLFRDGRDTKDRLSAFASFLFSNNARVGMLAFALGFAFGAPTVLLLLINGLTLGAFAALYVSRGLGYDFWGWLLIHGATELSAIVLCGAGGLMLGAAVVFPGDYTRLVNLGRVGRRAAVIVIGAVIMFFFAALLEGFGRQLILHTPTRYMVAAATMVGWLWYALRSGRQAR